MHRASPFVIETVWRACVFREAEKTIVRRIAFSGWSGYFRVPHCGNDEAALPERRQLAGRRRAL